MKANDLMIGDLVRVSKDVCIKKGTVVRVRGIDGDNRFPEKELVGCASCEQIDDRSVSGGVWCEYLEPIPITQEILEKNGFTCYSETYGILVDGFVIEIRFWEEPNIRICKRYDSIFQVGYDWVIDKLHIQSVHQLQHALRLCGITLNIEV